MDSINNLVLASLISILLTIIVNRVFGNSVTKQLLMSVKEMAKDLGSVKNDLAIFGERLTIAIKDISDNQTEHSEIHGRLNSLEGDMKVIKSKVK